MLVVKVIAATKFFGVPEELAPDYTKVQEKKQDVGSDSARLIECAGRTCYDSFGSGRPSSDYHTHIKATGHGSVTEHASISFYIDGVSRGLTHELVRHRAGTAISQRSTRYVDESESDWAHHPLVNKYKDALDFTSILQTVELCQREYKELAARLEELLVLDGIDKVNARKQARGAARGMLGNALTSAMVWTANIRALRNFLELRASPFADAEIRLFANKIYELSLEVMPEWFNDYTKVDVADKIGYGLETKYRKI